MASLTQRLLQRIGYVPKAEVARVSQTLASQVKSQVEARIKELGIDQKDRPQYRAPFMRGMAIPPAMKTTDYLMAYKGWVYACVRAIAEETANINLVLKKRKSQDEFEMVDAHPAIDLLHKVNPLYTSYLLWESTQAYMDLVGEAFWYLAGADKQGKEPKEIWVLRPDWVNVKDAKDKLISSYTYGPPGGELETIPFEQIIHFKDMNPINLYRGHGTIKAADVAIDTDTFAAKYNRQFFYNDASPGGVIHTDQVLDDETYDRIHTEWDNAHKGVEKSWKVAILEAGLEWQDVGLKQKDMQFIEQRRFSRDEIFSMFRVPKTLVAISDDVNRAASRESRAVFLENNIDHKQKRLVAFLNEFYLPRWGDEDLFFDYVSPVPADADAQLRTVDSGLTMGWMTRNEARELQGYETLDDPAADTLYIPFSLQPLGQPVSEGTKKLIAKKRLAHFNVRIPPITKNKKDFLIAYRNLEMKARALILLMASKRNPMKAEGGEPEDPADAREMHWKSIITRTNPRETNIRRILAELFRGQQSRVEEKVDNELRLAFEAGKITKSELDAMLDGKAPVGAVIKAKVDDIIDVTKENQIFFDPLMKYIRDVVESEGIIQIQELLKTAVFYMNTEEVKKFLKKDGAAFILSINEETRAQLKTQLALAIDAQESIPQIKKRVENVFGTAMGIRSEMIARTEITRATNFATEQAYIQSDVVEAKEWLTAKDERTCPFCGTMDGKVLDLGESYFDKGDKINGKDDDGKRVSITAGLTSVEAPPLHPNCRCTLIPVLKSKKAAPKKSKRLSTKVQDGTVGK